MEPAAAPSRTERLLSALSRARAMPAGGSCSEDPTAHGTILTAAKVLESEPIPSISASRVSANTPPTVTQLVPPRVGLRASTGHSSPARFPGSRRGPNEVCSTTNCSATRDATYYELEWQRSLV